MHVTRLFGAKGSLYNGIQFQSNRSQEYMDGAHIDGLSGSYQDNSEVAAGGDLLNGPTANQHTKSPNAAAYPS